MGKVLRADQFVLALQRIAEWRAEPGISHACPVCDDMGLLIVDRSARPHAEWYQLTCTACELDTALHIPLSGA